MSLITLLSDFGLDDTYVAQMKGVIATLSPGTQVIDLTHAVPAQNVLAGAVLLDDAVDVFPEHSIHLCVVDPGVGTPRRAVAIDLGRCTLVGPDNGLFSAVLQRFAVQRAVCLTSRAHQAESIPGVSMTFHGRDIFAPAAAYIAQGTPLLDLGEPIDDLTTLQIPRPVITQQQITAHVLMIDRFGNLITDLKKDVFGNWLGAQPRDKVIITLGPTTIEQIHQTYADVAVGQPVAYFGSSNRLEIAVREGSAHVALGATDGLDVLLDIVPQ